MVQALLQVYQQYGVDCEIWPMTPGAAPMYLFTRPPLGLPLVEGGLGHGGRHHAADEYLVIEGDGRVAGLVEAEMAFVDFLYTYAGMGGEK